ncbi:LuxR family transcriptional regulator [Micromonospora pisi]|uniref:LuxR family transcriptional regulator n=1 Tax=Micromonospora pisi TaxID=589240 RepID=A0A495JT69_9ACTN|nr:LuxR family transcriptional regulator [Micromonospora pisi]RKR91269.1 LuxR family transcriptional regulator [Micromonospora pisi]
MDVQERAGALDELDKLLVASATEGRIAIVSGEAGAGKSTLVDVFANRVTARAWLVWGQCDPLLTPRALGPLHDIARQVGGALAERLAGVDAEQRPDTVFDAFLDLLDGPRQRRRPVVVIEDLHWADGATLDLLGFLGRRLSRCRALLILTYREDEVGPLHPLRRVLAALPRTVTRRLPLAPLTITAIGHLARHSDRSANEIYEVTGGNPLLVTEVLGATGTEVPATVTDLVLGRLATVSVPAREVAALVSVVPSGAEPALLESCATTAVEECLARGVLVAAGDQVAFRHELLRRAMERSLSPARRAALHATVLATLARRPGVDPARLVHHAHHADDAAAVLRWVPVAAQRATAVRAYRQAADHYATALPRSVGLLPARRAELLESYSFAAYLAGLGEAALDARREALTLREDGGDALRIGDNLRWVSRLAWWTGRTGEARSVARQAVDVLERVPPGRELAMAYSNVSQLHMLANEETEAIEWGERALTLAGELGDVETQAHALVNVGSARLQRGETAGAAQLDRAHTLAATAGLDDHAARALVNLGTFAADGWDFVLATDALDRALRFTTTRNLDGYARHLLGYRARIRLVQGDWAAARADAEQALVGIDKPGVSLVPALAVLGCLRSRRGEPEALAVLELAAALAGRADEIQYLAPTSAALAEHHWLAGEPRQTADAVRDSFALVREAGLPWSVGELGFWLWRAGEPVDVPDWTAAPYLMLIRGDWAGAAAEFQRRGCAYPRIEALSHGGPAAAAEALAALARLGANAAARRLRAVLRERGVAGVPRGPRAAAGANASGLTPRQLEVVALLADGLSNSEIALRLSLSAKTVDHHVSAVLGKLDVTTRGRAAAAARRLGLVPPE